MFKYLPKYQPFVINLAVKLSVPTEFKQESKQADSSEASGPVVLTNTELHNAIIENNTNKAIELIRTKDAAFINQKSLGNTALMLALKSGNIPIVKELLNRPNVQIDARDDRGLTPLHWACMLRQDEVIISLIDKGADPYAVTESWSSKHPHETFVPYDLYIQPVNYKAFDEYGLTERAYFPLNNIAIEREKEVLCFTDRPTLAIEGAIAYTDIIFHMKRLCENLRLTDAFTISPFISKSESGVESDLFRVNFNRGNQLFCMYRNAIPVNEDILELMQQKQKTAKCSQ